MSIEVGTTGVFLKMSKSEYELGNWIRCVVVAIEGQTLTVETEFGDTVYLAMDDFNPRYYVDSPRVVNGDAK